tara:strand:+ start:98 stop:352 length:255 start_codon:yes stop_codon:yes gene_type:complete
MTNNEILIKQIIYRSNHRGSKEMDILLGNFVKKNLNLLNRKDLEDLKKLLLVEDEIIYDWFFKKISNKKIIKNKVSLLLRNFKL